MCLRKYHYHGLPPTQHQPEVSLFLQALHSLSFLHLRSGDVPASSSMSARYALGSRKAPSLSVVVNGHAHLSLPRLSAQATESRPNIGSHSSLHRQPDMRPNNSFPPCPRCVCTTPLPTCPPLCNVWASNRAEGSTSRKCILPAFHNIVGYWRDEDHHERICYCVVFAIRKVRAFPPAHQQCVRLSI